MIHLIDGEKPKPPTPHAYSWYLRRKTLGEYLEQQRAGMFFLGFATGVASVAILLTFWGAL